MGWSASMPAESVLAPDNFHPLQLRPTRAPQMLGLDRGGGQMRRSLLVVVGAVAGGFVGYFAFFWVVRQGYYGIMLPGLLLGAGAGLFKNRSFPLALLCGLAAVALGLFTEWRFAPFIADRSL